VLIHAEVYRKAQRMTVKSRRSAVKTVSSENYAAMLAGMSFEAGSPTEKLKVAVRRYAGLYLPVSHWENILFPARVPGYRPALLDALLSDGISTWRISQDGEKLAFFPPDSVDWDAGIPENDPSDAAKTVRGILIRRGASFSSAVSAALPGESTVDILNRMAGLGDVVCDSFAPMRKISAGLTQKQRMKARVSGVARGRWEIARPICEPTIEDRLNAAFERWGIVCRETAAMEGIRFSDVLELLRRKEYTAEVRRGYFVEGLSGAQFVRSVDFERIGAALQDPEKEPVCLNALDPAQAWGKVLKHESDRAFLCVSGTAVVTAGGRVKMLLERRGAVLRSFGADEEDVAAAVRAFRSGRLFPEQSVMTVRECPKDMGELLEKAGFVREMNDYVLDKRGV